MIRLRVLAVAFLLNGDDVLMMKRSTDGRLFAGFWAGVGGHVEPSELNQPQVACLRELQEEIGLDASELADLKLCYIVNRLAGEEIRVQYVYFGKVDRLMFPACDEGELHWVNWLQALHLKTSFTTREILRHFFDQSTAEHHAVQVGTVSVREGKPILTWVPLQDWE